MKKVFLLLAALFAFALPCRAAVVINEVCIENNWIELYNNGASDVNLDGYYLSDDAEEPYLWRIPAVTLSEADMLIVYTTGENNALFGTTLKANFKLSAGETLFLTAPSAETLCDCVKIPKMADGSSYARARDGKYPWEVTREPTAGKTRSGIEAVRYAGGEASFVEASFTITGAVNAPEGEDYITITNNGASASLRGWYISDEEKKPRLWQFPDTYLESGASINVFASGKNRTVGELHTNFKLSDGETVSLYNPQGTLKAQWIINEAQTAVAFSHEGGFYTNEFYLTLSSPVGSAIYYTLDGSTPGADNPQSMLYSTPIRIYKPIGEDVFSRIPSNPSFDSSQQFSGYRIASRGYLQPYANGNKCLVVCASAGGDVITKTYFVDPRGAARYSLPVLSLSCAPSELFSDERGILVPGKGGTPNYAQTSDSWERVLNAELYSSDGAVLFNQRVGAKTHGGGGRHSTQKSLRLNPKSEYGKSKIKNTFLDTAAKSYGKLLLRNGGQGPNHMGFDDLSGTIMRAAGGETQEYCHCVVFIDGEYWGIYALKETADSDALEANYFLPKEMFAVLENNCGIIDGKASDAADFRAIVDFAQSHDMNIEENYKYISDRVDLRDLATHFIVQSYMVNTDWPHGNIKFWRLRTQNPILIEDSIYDGRWRWMLYDADCTFGSRYDSSAAQMNFAHDILNGAINSNNPSSKLLKAMLTSDKYKSYFLQRIEDLCQGVLSPEAINNAVNKLDGALRPEMYEHVVRWRYPALAANLTDRAAEVPSTAKWDENIAAMHRFANERVPIFAAHVNRLFGTAQKGSLWLCWDDSCGSVYTTQKLSGGDALCMYGVGEKITLCAVAHDGYRFVKWSGAYGDIYSDSIVFTMKDAMTMRANFEPF